MIKIVKANPGHVEGISKVCSDGYRATYGDTNTEDYIERVIREFYNRERILDEVSRSDRHWGGYFVAGDDDLVVGAGGGGMTGKTTAELFVLYMDPRRRNEGIGTKLLDAITKQQKDEYQAEEQWVSVQKGNDLGIPFGEEYISLRYYRKI
ncbi:N-acetyltransferase [Bacillus salacetis]|uniref:N-acetyltransferase n=1 Tax=Bacillus salacetis TaxID=2315464 RepID=A0A3A1QYV3_9BACI|nr:GNAT family N-acetyltransferase [Bacillus salacetis]RIW34011.1 N-acetyltransferase [Bacillus salacetis]